MKTAKKFLLEKLKWSNKDKGQFDFNGILELLENYNEYISSDFESSSNLMIKYMAENHHPHTMANIDSTKSELFEGVKSNINNYFKK